jgi:tetratricopeptide (TPR) repeat protein
MPAPRPNDQDHRRPWLPRLLLALAVAAVYANTLQGPFHLDDEVSILENESLHHLSELGNVLWPRSEVFTAGRPLLNLSFALNFAWGGTSPTGYHAVNLGIHIAAVLVLAALIRRTLTGPVLGGRFAGSASWIAHGAALLWGVHPLLTVSVTYVSQRAESLMGLCYLVTLYAVARAADGRRRWSAIAIGACLAGMLVKEVMVTAPMVALLFDAALVSGSFAETWRKRRGLYLGLAATWIALAVTMSAARIQDRSIGFGFDYTWLEYLRVESGAIFRYFQLALLPHPLVFDYGSKVPVPAVLQSIIQAGLLVALGGSILIGWRRHRALAFLGAWVLLVLAPTSSVVPVSGQPIAENRFYLPLAAMSALFAAAAWRAAGQRAAAALVLSAGGALAVGTLLRNETYNSDRGLWAETIRLRPENARAHVYYGIALMQEGKLAEAVRPFEEAVRLDPGYIHAHLNLGSLYLRTGRTADALRCYRHALQQRPSNPVAHNNLGTALYLAGQTEEALQHYREAVRLRPGFIDATVNLGIALAKLGRWTEAAARFEEVLRRRPDHPVARDSLRQIQSFQRATAPTVPP